MSAPKRSRPQLRLELADLGTVDPFRLELAEHPPGSGHIYLVDPGRRGARASLERAGLGLAGAAQALLGLSVRWLEVCGREQAAAEVPLPLGEVRLRLQRRDARLLASLLRRHLARLPQPPAWMGELLTSLQEIDEYLRWTDGGLSLPGKNMDGP